MTPNEMIARFREEAFDDAIPPKWSDDLVLLYLNEAEQEAARRARLYEDADTGETCKITVKANKATYDVDPRVIYIRRVKLDGMTSILPKADSRDLDVHVPDWETQTAEQPGAWTPRGNHKLTLVPTPTVDDVLRMVVVREPLEAMTKGGEAPELPARVHARLVDYALALAFMNQDTEEKQRPQEAQRRMALFDREFGPPESSVTENWIRRRHGYDDYEGLA